MPTYRSEISNATALAPDDWAGGIALAERQAKIERAGAVASLQCYPRSAAIIESSGATIADFEHDDLAAVVGAVQWGHERCRPLIDVLILARRVLKRIGHWDPANPAGNVGSLWSDAMLARAATGNSDFAAASLPKILRELNRLAALWEVAA